MQFTVESQTVKSYVLLINQGLKTIDDVPNIYNLRDAVQDALNN